MAVGGKGAPLVPFLDYQLFRHPSIARVALNIGGIANIAFIPASARAEDVIAFDTGPGNMVIDAVAPPFDRNGDKARAGRVNEALLEQLINEDPYYRRDPPKACGREQFGAEFVQRTGLNVATATELTVRTIGIAIGKYPATKEVIVSGGGAHNGYIMERLASVLKQRVTTSAEFGIGVDSKEAILFAVLAYQTYRGRAGNLPSATGARKPAILGKVSYR